MYKTRTATFCRAGEESPTPTVPVLALNPHGVTVGHGVALFLGEKCLLGEKVKQSFNGAKLVGHHLVNLKGRGRNVMQLYHHFNIKAVWDGSE